MNLDHIKIDDNHLELIYSLVICHKPKSVLELGIGSGYTTRKIIDGFIYNNIQINLDCVDNFYDWHGNCPEHINDLKDNIRLIVSNEQDYIYQCKNYYDMIISDADHGHTDQWIDKTIGILNTNGILIYHDVTNKDFPNLYRIIEYIKLHQYRYFLFNQNSLLSERCQRGLLVIQNDK